MGAMLSVMSGTRSYPHGVPSWVDTEQTDIDAAREFYQGLFGWSFATVSPPGAPFYAVATLGGRDVSGLGAAQQGPAAWNTYISVDDADAVAARAARGGGQVLMEPADAGEGGRAAALADPGGARFRVWQARKRPGAQAVNEPGTWNFSDLHTNDPNSSAFYRDLFGWSLVDLGFATMLRVPGYGDHLEATVDPDIRARQQGITAPVGFEDAIGWVGPLEEASAGPHWHVTFAVADRDASAALAGRLGADVLSTEDTQWTRTALVRDPQGAVFTASQFTPPESSGGST